VAKIGTGLTDDEWRQLKEKAEKFRVNTMPAAYDVDKMMDCDVWITPALVVEIKADEISRSTIHTAGRLLKPTKSGNSSEIDVAGFALRFPRLERFRDDKKPTDSTQVKEIENMFKKQGAK
jgi:DNA ligase-1